ncbi:hypothetical protein [Umezakia ovalisporum]|uniref:hypothetical protein n=1 Tax=Umezakia ovalisporum TaxID=75695 RepID=UPI0035B77A7A
MVNFDYVNVFCYENKARITFWFPDSAIPIVLNPKSNLDDYEKIIEHIEYLTGLQAEMLNVVTKLYIVRYSSPIKGENVNIS